MSEILRPDTPEQLQEAVAWAVGEGLLSGSPEGQLNPQGNTTRAELAQILMNYVA